MGKIVRKDYLLTAVENVKYSRFFRGKMFYYNDDTALYGIVLLRL